MPDKQWVRRKVRSMRETQSLSDQQEKSRAICSRILSFPLFSQENVRKKKIALYFMHKGEVDLETLKEYFIRNGGICFFPITYPNEIIMGRYDPSQSEREQCKIGAMGIREPSKGNCDSNNHEENGDIRPFERMDWIFLPGIAYDLSGNRIGYGKGYYDRYLAQYDICRQPLLIAPAYEFQVFSRIDSDLHDRPVDMIVTENKIISIDNGK